MKLCRAICIKTPVASTDPNKFLDEATTLVILQHKYPIIKISINAPNTPNSSQIIEKIISFCASGIALSFCVEFPKPFPKKPPLPIAYNACSV